MRTRHFWLAAFALACCFELDVFGCDLCRGGRGDTLMQDYDKAAVVLLAHVEENPRFVNNLYLTDFVIDDTFKPHKAVGNAKNITVNGYSPKSSKVILFIDVANSNLNPIRSVEATSDGAMAQYLKGAAAVKNKAPNDRLRFSFDYLHSPHYEIAIDAYREFANAPYQDYATMARTLPADKIAGWLQDPRTPPLFYGLYSSLLGHCGKAEHAKILRSMVETSIRKKNWDIDGLLAGYVMLQPREGWAYLRELMRDGKQDYLIRYACVRTADFLRAQRPDLVPAKELTDGVALALEFSDLADKAIDFLRKAKCWERTDQVLNLPKKKGADRDFDNSYVRREVLLFAVACPEARAVAFVKELRRRDPQKVADAEQVLKAEEILNLKMR